MNKYQKEAILRCLRCKHEWEIYYEPGNQYPCPNCEGFNQQI